MRTHACAACALKDERHVTLIRYARIGYLVVDVHGVTPYAGAGHGLQHMKQDIAQGLGKAARTRKARRVGVQLSRKARPSDSDSSST